MVAILIIAAAQAAILAASLLVRKRHNAANRTLAVWLLLLAIDLLFAAAIAAQMHTQFPVLVAIKFGWPFLHGPMLYLYTRHLTLGERPHGTDILHFLPFALTKIALGSFLLLPAPEQLAFIEHVRLSKPLWIKLEGAALPLHGLAYVLSALLLMQRYRKRVLQFFSYTEKIYLTWLYTMLMINLFIWAMVTFNEVHELFSGPGPLDAHVYTAVSVWIFVIGLFGFNQPAIFREQSTGASAAISGSPVERPAAAQDFVAAEKYAKTRLSPERRNAVRLQLTDYMAQKPWLESALTIKDISNATGVPIHHISQVINDDFGENLFTFINRHRIDLARTLLVDPRYRNMNVLRIAFECGFNSKSSFNSVFKQQVGVTPTEFRRNTGNA